jgi:hypothetical protein
VSLCLCSSAIYWIDEKILMVLVVLVTIISRKGPLLVSCLMRGSLVGSACVFPLVLLKVLCPSLGFEGAVSFPGFWRCRVLPLVLKVPCPSLGFWRCRVLPLVLKVPCPSLGFWRCRVLPLVLKVPCPSLSFEGAVSFPWVLKVPCPSLGLKVPCPSLGLKVPCPSLGFEGA